MIRLTEPIPCPFCRRLVVPGEERWYDLLADYTAGPIHVCRPCGCPCHTDRRKAIPGCPCGQPYRPSTPDPSQAQR